MRQRQQRIGFVVVFLFHNNVQHIICLFEERKTLNLCGFHRIWLMKKERVMLQKEQTMLDYELNMLHFVGR